MSDHLVDSEGNVYQRGLLGDWQRKEGVFGPQKDVDWLGNPKVKQNLVGQRVVARDFLGQPVQNASGQGLFEASSSSGGDQFGDIGGAIGAVIAIVVLWAAVLLFIAAFRLLAYLVKAWIGLTRRYPRVMLVVHLALGMGGTYAGLNAAGFAIEVCVAGSLLVPVLWAWLWLTSKLPLVFMPINAAILGGGLWWASRATEPLWQSRWSLLTTGLPLVGNLSAVLAGLPMFLWVWRLAGRRWPRSVAPTTCLVSGVVLWFGLTRVWPDWLPYWNAFVSPLPVVPPIGDLLLIGPLWAWLWGKGMARYPVVFTGLNLVVFGCLLSLSARHTPNLWLGPWQYVARGLPFVGVPILSVGAAPFSVWTWGRLANRYPRVFALPNLALTGAVLWLLLNRTRPLWNDAWEQIRGPVPINVDPALVVLGLPLAFWAWRQGRKRWPTLWWMPRCILLGVIFWLLASRTIALWQTDWLIYAGPRAPDFAVLLGVFPLVVGAWGYLHARRPTGADSLLAISLCALFVWTTGRSFPMSTTLVRLIVGVIPLLVLGWSALLRRRPVVAWAIAVVPWLVAALLFWAFPAPGGSLVETVRDWFLGQGILLP